MDTPKVDALRLWEADELLDEAIDRGYERYREWFGQEAAEKHPEAVMQAVLCLTLFYGYVGQDWQRWAQAGDHAPAILGARDRYQAEMDRRKAEADKAAAGSPTPP